MTDVQSFISKTLHNLLFIEEFVFARNQFSPPAGSELELADAVVMLGDVLLICQIKERSAGDAGDEQGERRWFETKVLKRATKQRRDTLGYLRAYSEIRVPNERGHVFNLGGRAFTDILKLVIYVPSANLPDDCRRIRQHVSRTAGFIHIVDAHDYLEIARTLRVPEEVVRYFRYREAAIRSFGAPCAQLPEPAFAGHFVGGDLKVAPTMASIRHLHQLVQDADEWDLAPLMRGLHDHLSVPGIGDDYYDILMEFARLPRSAWREVKRRIVLCVEKVKKDEITHPYRMVFPETDCGFVFIPVASEIVLSPGWQTARVRGLQQLTRAHKYDQRLSKCVGVLVAKDGEYFSINWCLIAHEWREDLEIERVLKENFPFRPVKVAEAHGYRFVQDSE